MIQNLEKKGLVSHTENPADRRSKLLAMERKEALYQAGETIERQATANLIGEECGQLAGLLRKMPGQK